MPLGTKNGKITFLENSFSLHCDWTSLKGDTVFFNKSLFLMFLTPQIRNELEKQMNCNLKEFKEFIDNEMLLILGQMDKPSLIFDHLYLVRGSAHVGVWLGEHKSDLGCLERGGGGGGGTRVTGASILTFMGTLPSPLAAASWFALQSDACDVATAGPWGGCLIVNWQPFSDPCHPFFRG